MLLLPLARLADAEWPAAIDEYLLPDGRLLLVDARADYRGDGIVRSRPRHAARILMADGRIELGYVVAVRRRGGAVSAPPDGIAWSPASPDCELAVRTPGTVQRWLPCTSVLGVAQPNRMGFGARFRLSMLRFLPAVPIHP